MSAVASLVAVALGLVVVGPAAGQPSATGSVRHSGRIVQIGLDLSSIVLEEMVTWNGPGASVVRRSIRLTPRTSITLLESADGRDGGSTNGWRSAPIAVTTLREGDFVTVTTDPGRRIASTLHVVRPEGDD